MKHEFSQLLPTLSARFNRLASAALVAGVVGAFSPGDAGAGVTLITTPFTGLTTDFTSIGNQMLPYTDADGRTIDYSGGTPGIFNTVGLGLSNLPISLMFSNLASTTNEVGFSILPGVTSPDVVLTSATFSNGDAYTSPLSLLPISFFGFLDTAPFTSVTLNFSTSTGGTAIMTDFRTQSLLAAPEPPSLALLGLGAALGLAYARRRHHPTPAV